MFIPFSCKNVRKNEEKPNRNMLLYIYRATCVKPSLPQRLGPSYCYHLQRAKKHELRGCSSYCKVNPSCPQCSYASPGPTLMKFLDVLLPRTQGVKAETSCFGWDPRRGHASACRDADCETSVQQWRHTHAPAHKHMHTHNYYITCTDTPPQICSLIF